MFIRTLLGIVGAAVPAHGWYDSQCCSDRDCRPAIQGEIVAQGRGWLVVPTGEVFPPLYGEITTIPNGRDTSSRHTYRSQDGQFHRCSADGQTSTMTFCIYVPDPGA